MFAVRIVLAERIVPRDANDELIEILDALEALLCVEIFEPRDESDSVESSRWSPESRGWWEGLPPWRDVSLYSSV